MSRARSSSFPLVLVTLGTVLSAALFAASAAFPGAHVSPREPGKPRPCVEPFHQNPRPDPTLLHDAETFAEQYNGGRLGGSVAAASRLGDDGALAMAHHDARDLSFRWDVADEYVLFGRLFSSLGWDSLRDHMYAMTGTPATSSKHLPGKRFDLRTISLALQERRISGKRYIEDYRPEVNLRTVGSFEIRSRQVLWAPLLVFPRFVDGPPLRWRIVDLRGYFKDAERGQLPPVSFIASRRHSELTYSREAGQTFLRGLVDALMTSAAWDRSAFMWTYDDWRGWYDHVKPPQVDEFGYTLRVPTLLVAPTS